MTDRQAVIDALTKPFPPQAIKDLKGRPYVSGTTVIYRLNDATNYDWEFEITGHELVGGADSQGNKPAQVVYGRMRIPIVSPGWRADLGTQALENMPDDHEAYKGAATDCLKRCARQFGVGLHLWGPDIEAGEIGNRGRVDQPRQQVRPEMVSVPDAGGGFRRVPADSPAAIEAARQDAAQMARQQDGSGPPMTDKQRGFLISLAKELGMVSDNGHHDAAALDAELKQFCGLTVDTLTVGKAKEVIDEFVIRRDIRRGQPSDEPHPKVQQAIDNREANWLAAIEGAATMGELQRIGAQIAEAGVKEGPLRVAYANRRDRLQEKALV